MIKPASKNTTQTPEEIEFTQKVEAILWDKYSPEGDTKIIKKQISDALNWDKHRAIFLLSKDIHLYDYLPVALQREPELMSLVIRNDPKKYIQLDTKSRQNAEIQEIALRETISKRWNVMEIIGILESGNKKNKKIWVLADELISKLPGYFSDAWSTYLYEIYKSEPKLFVLFSSKWLIDISSWGAILWNRFVTYLAKAQSKLEWYSEQECKDVLIWELLEILWLKQDSLSKQGAEFLQYLVSSISIVHKPEQEDEQNETEVVEASQDTLLDDIDDELHYEKWPYNYIPLWNTCTVWDSQGSSTVLEKNILDIMSEKSLENYMNFTKLCKNLWLEFMITRQARLSQIATWVDFYQGEWMSESRTLRFLSSVWKNIWVPEESWEDSQWNKKIWYFKTLWYAKEQFRTIRDTQTVSGINFTDRYTWNKTIIEIYLKHIWLLWEPFWDISIANWKK